MKKIISILFCLSLCITAFSQQYKIYDNTCKATIMRLGSNEFKPCEKNAIVSEKDIIKASKKNGIRILDCSTNRIYSNVKSGSFSIGQIVKSANSKSSSVFSSLNKELLKSVKGDKPDVTYVTYGATSRGNATYLSIVDSLYSTIYYGIENADAVSTSDFFAKQVTEDGLMSFSVVNNSSELLYFQMVMFDGERASFCYDFQDYLGGVIPINTKTTLDLSPYKFSIEPSSQFYLIYSTRPFSVSALKHMLSTFNEPKDKLPIPDLSISRVK